MPSGDGRGPAGFGPLSGRGAGYCAGYQIPGYMNRPTAGFRRGFGRGLRRSYRYNTYEAPASAYSQPAYFEDDNEAEYLRNRAKALEDELNYIKKQLEKREKNEEN